MPHAGRRARREMRNAHAQTDGLASVANVSALMLYPSVINQTFPWNKLSETLRLFVDRQHISPRQISRFYLCYAG